MYELFFIIIFSDSTIIKEQFSDSFNTQQECLDEGWIRAYDYSDQILERYPELSGFDVECRVKFGSGTRI